MNHQSAVLLAPGHRVRRPSRSHDAKFLIHSLMLGICLEQFGRLSADEQQLLTAVDVRRESYDEIAERLGIYRYALPQAVFGARHRLHAGVMRRLAETAPVAGVEASEVDIRLRECFPEHFPT